jgi:hypothetical protein
MMGKTSRPRRAPHHTPDNDGLAAGHRTRDRIVRSRDSEFRKTDRRSQLECMSQRWVGRRRRRMPVLKGRPGNDQLLTWPTGIF